MASNPWSAGNTALRLRALHSEESKLLEEKTKALEEQQKALAVAKQKAQSKVWAQDKAKKRIRYNVKDISGNEQQTSSECSGFCDANEDALGWWHCGCSIHCYCQFCKTTNTGWQGIE
jgi:hypothetical protein